MDLDLLSNSVTESLANSLPARKQRDVAYIVTSLHKALDTFLEGKTGSKAKYKILKIILFGSHAKGTWVNDPVNGYMSDYDILVIVNAESLVEEYEVWNTAEERIMRSISSPLGLIVHTLADVNSKLKQGHYFFKDIREEGVELYSVAGKELAQLGDLTEEERLIIASKHFQQWFESATDFYETFIFAKGRGKLKQAAFLLHQTTERFFACTLLVCTNYLPRTHDIEHLRSLCAQQDTDFASLFPADNKFHRRSFQRLKRAYVDARYSEHYEITLEELNYLADEVKRLQKITEVTCRGKIETT